MEGLGGATRSGVVGGARTGRGAALWAGRGRGGVWARTRLRRARALWRPRPAPLGTQAVSPRKGRSGRVCSPSEETEPGFVSPKGLKEPGAPCRQTGGWVWTRPWV